MKDEDEIWTLEKQKPKIHGLPISEFIDNFMSRYSRIRDISRELEGEATWEDNPLFQAALDRIVAIPSRGSL